MSERDRHDVEEPSDELRLFVTNEGSLNRLHVGGEIDMASAPRWENASSSAPPAQPQGPPRRPRPGPKSAQLLGVSGVCVSGVI